MTVFERIELQLNQYSVDSDPEQIKNFNNQVYQATASIWAYKRKVLGLILQCKVVSNNYPLLVDHISREAAYFANRLQDLNAGQLEPKATEIIQENVFFLRVMGDHAKFIGKSKAPFMLDFIY